jgi:hypothetical protein
MRNIYHTLLLTGVVLVSPLIASADSDRTAGDWFKNSYGPLWADTPYQDIEAILTHYHSEIVTHGSDGSLSTTPSREWLTAPMDSWREEGWVRAELTDMTATSINAATTGVMTVWTDYYAGDVTETSCGWYLVDAINDEWKITHYADTPCS